MCELSFTCWSSESNEPRAGSLLDDKLPCFQQLRQDDHPQYTACLSHALVSYLKSFLGAAGSIHLTSILSTVSSP